MLFSDVFHDWFFVFVRLPFSLPVSTESRRPRFSGVRLFSGPVL